MLDPGPLGLAPGEWEVVPDFDAALRRLLTGLDDAAPPVTGVGTQARAALAAAQQAWADTDADFDRGPAGYQARSVISAPRLRGLNRPETR